MRIAGHKATKKGEIVIVMPCTFCYNPEVILRFNGPKQSSDAKICGKCEKIQKNASRFSGFCALYREAFVMVMWFRFS